MRVDQRKPERRKPGSGSRHSYSNKPPRASSGPSRRQQPVYSPEERAARERVQKICDLLGENEARSMGQVRSILEKRGIDYIKECLVEAKRIQDSGGMLTDDGKRKRTFGGVFFIIVKQNWHKGVSKTDILSLD